MAVTAKSALNRGPSSAAAREGTAWAAEGDGARATERGMAYLGPLHASSQTTQAAQERISCR